MNTESNDQDGVVSEPTRIQMLQQNEAAKSLARIIIGAGLVGLVLWLSPWTLTELLMTIFLPIMLILIIAVGLGLTGDGLLKLLNSKELGERVQRAVREMEAEARRGT